MSNRSAKFVMAVFAGVLAGASLTAVTDLRAQAAADNCLASPKGTTPAGSHWYYRIDRATKRQCWYLREESDTATRAAPPQESSSAEAEPAPAQPRTITRQSVADARAEWVSQQARAEQNSSANAGPPTTGTIAAPNVQGDKRAMGVNVLAPTPLASTRWPDITSVNSANPGDLRTAAAADPPAPQPQEAAEPQQPAAAPVAPAAAEPAKPTASLQMLFLVMAAALALAGITVSLVVRIGRMRARRARRRKRLAMWDSARTRRAPPPTFPDEEAEMWRTEAVHNRRTHGNRKPQVTDTLARLARSAQG